MSYRRFNNIKRLLKVEDYSPSASSNPNSPEYRELVKKVGAHNIKFGVDSPSFRETEGLRYTLGFEIETIKGSVSEEDSADLNVQTMHDGSLRPAGGGDPEGAEYVTGVLKGDAGFKQLSDLCRVLQSSCKIDQRCGVHVHIGSLGWTNEDIVYAYLLGERIQKDMFSILPESRRNNSYCRTLTPLSKNLLALLKPAMGKPSEYYNTAVSRAYKIVFNEVSGGVDESSSCNSTTQHPRGEKCGYSKRSQRYCWLNFVPLVFSTRGSSNAKTLEIRSHGATMNYTKIKQWTKIWIAFVQFVNNHKNSIVNGYYVDGKGAKFKITLELLVKLAYPKGGDKLVDYIIARRELFKTNDESVDYASEEGLTKKSIKELVCA